MNVVAIGGGHGTAVTLQALRRLSNAVTGVVSVADNGGSSGRLREMMDVAARHGVKAKTEGFPMAKVNEAIEKVKKNKVRYRDVLAN